MQHRRQRWDARMEMEFHTGQFLWGAFIFAIVPSVIILLPPMTGAWNIKSQRPKTLLPLIAIAMACISGLLPAGLWLSWTGGSPMPHYLQRGAPTQLPAWQVIGFGATVVILSALILIKYSRHRNVLSCATVITTAGFTTAYAHAESFGVSTQEAVGVFLSYIGINLLLLATNGICLGVIKWREPRKSNQG